MRLDVEDFAKLWSTGLSQETGKKALSFYSHADSPQPSSQHVCDRDTGLSSKPPIRNASRIRLPLETNAEASSSANAPTQHRRSVVVIVAERPAATPAFQTGKFDDNMERSKDVNRSTT